MPHKHKEMNNQKAKKCAYTSSATAEQQCAQAKAKEKQESVSAYTMSSKKMTAQKRSKASISHTTSEMTQNSPTTSPNCTESLQGLPSHTLLSNALWIKDISANHQKHLYKSCATHKTLSNG